MSISVMRQASDAIVNVLAGGDFDNPLCDLKQAALALRQAIAEAEKREWVGLTEQDVHDAFQFTELIKQLSFDRERPEWCENFAAYLEAKLKEKNDG